MAAMNRPARGPDSTAHHGPRRKLSRPVLALGLLALLVCGYGLWRFPDWRAQAQLGAAYGARMGCSCRHVQGRDIESCRRDREPGMELVSIADVPDARAVEASVPLLASRTARFEPGTGCIIDP